MSETGGGIVLEGLDGGTPLGFFAALGVQQALAAAQPSTLLSWKLLDAWRPVLHGPTSIDEVVDAVRDDAGKWETAPILAFRYLKQEKNGPKEVGGLRAPVGVLRKWMLHRRSAADETSLAYACALMCETATEPLEEAVGPDVLAKRGIEVDDGAPLDRVTMPTFFDFTSRNAQFLEQVAAIRAYLDRSVVEAGLVHGRLDPRAPRTLYWDPSADTPAAIYTGFAGGFLPAAEWLAFRGLVCFPLAGSGSRLVATACSGRRKEGELVWPLWGAPAGIDAVRSLVAHPGLARLDGAARAALGISTVLRAALTKQADGKTGMFSPAQPV